MKKFIFVIILLSSCKKEIIEPEPKHIYVNFSGTSGWPGFTNQLLKTKFANKNGDTILPLYEIKTSTYIYNASYNNTIYHRERKECEFLIYGLNSTNPSLSAGRIRFLFEADFPNDFKLFYDKTYFNENSDPLYFYNINPDFDSLKIGNIWCYDVYVGHLYDSYVFREILFNRSFGVLEWRMATDTFSQTFITY